MPKNTSERIIDAGGAAYAPGAIGASAGGAVRRGLHTLATIDGLGAEHSTFGLTVGMVLRATSAATAAFAAIQDSDLPATIARAATTLTAGAGLTGGGDLSANRTFAVGAGLGITVNADDVALTTPGSLTATSTNSSTGSHTHAIDATIARAATTLTAGAGLTGGGDLSANRTFAVGAGLGITVNADDVALTTPGSLTATSTNSSTGSHTHAITSSSNPGAAASILASDASGYLRLVRLGVGMAPSRHLDVTGDIGLSGTLYADGGLIDFGTDYFQEGASYLDLKGSKPLQLDQTLQANGGGWSITKAGGATFAGDLAVGTSVLTVNVAGTRVGINRTPDAQFSLDVAGAIRGDYLVGKHALQLDNAAAIIHFDGPAPYNLDYTGTSSSHMGSVSTEAGGLIYRPGRFGKAAQMSEATTNLIPNPSFDSATTGFTYYNNSVATVLSDEGVFGNTCLSFAVGAGISPYLYTSYTTGLATGQSYTFSGYVKAGNASTVGATVTIRLRENSDGAYVSATTATLTGEWQRITVTRTLTHATPTSLNYYITLTSAASSGFVMLVDGLQLEQKAYPTPYCDGSLGTGHSWSGTAHASTSSRTAASIDFGNLVNRSQYTIAGWFKMAMAENDGVASLWQPTFFQIGTYNTNPSMRLGKYSTNGYINMYSRTTTAAGWTIGGSSAANLDYVAGDWIFLAVTYDGTYHRVYSAKENQDAVGKITMASTPGHYGTGERMRLAVDAGFGLDLVDEVIVLDTAASDATISAIYHSDAPVFAESSVQFFRSPSPAPIWVDEFGLWAKSTSGNAILGVYAGDPRRVAASRAWGGLDLEDNDVLIGRSTGGYVHWDDSAQVLNVSGTITATAGSIAGALTMGASGGIYQGTGTFASPTTGLKIWNDAGVGRIGGYNAGVLQWNAGTDGKLYAVGGTIGGWTLGANTLTGGLITLASGGYITIGSGSAMIGFDVTSPSGAQLWAGASSFGGAPFSVDKDGNMVANQATIVGAITASSGSITGALTLGASGGIYQGTGTFASPTTGLKIWNDSGVGRIGGYNAGTLQWYAGTDGKLYAGAGAVALSAAGIEAEISTTYGSVPAYEFTSGGNTVSGLWAQNPAGSSEVLVGANISNPNSLYNYVAANKDSGVTIRSAISAATTNSANIVLDAVNASGSTRVTLTLQNSASTGALISFSHTPKVGTDAIWHAGNDGSGSGLDADKLDTYQAADFGRLAGAQTWTAAQTFSAGLRVSSDPGAGASGTFSLTNVANVAANSTGVGTVKLKGTTSRDSAGFIKVWYEGTAYYVPVWAVITG
jgi:uncharacterized protein (DUF2147 family)